MRQELSERRKSGPKTIWEDLPKLYEDFGGEERFNELLDKLSWTGEWGERTALILRARRDGHVLEEIAAVLEIAHENVLGAERRGLQALYDLRDSKLVALPRLREGQGAKAIWNNPRGIMEHYGGEEEFNKLLLKLEMIKSDKVPEWGKRLAGVLRSLMSGKFSYEIASDYGLGSNRISALGHQGLEVLDALASGENVVPPDSGGAVGLMKRVGEILRRYGSEEDFWNLMRELEDIFWKILDDKTYQEAWQVAESLAILRARADGKSSRDIGRALGLTKQRAQQLEKWALQYLDQIYRGEEIQFRFHGGHSRKE